MGNKNVVAPTEEENVQLMVLKYQELALNPYKMRASSELMMLQKTLLRDAVKTLQMNDLQWQCPLVSVSGLKGIDDDDLKFVSNESRIDAVQMSSEIHRNFFLIAKDE